MIAMTLSMKPDVLIADEPTASLDVTTQKEILELIDELKKEYNMAMIFISHDLAVVAERCDHVAVMYHGEIVEGRKPKIFLQHQKMIIRSYLSMRFRRFHFKIFISVT